MTFGETICAPATSVSGAVAIVRVSGPAAFDICDKVVSFKRGGAASAPGYSIRFGEVEGLDEVLVSIFRAPYSYTGEDGVEISCHASPYIVSALLERLCAAGARMAGPGEFTRRAYLAGKMDLAQAEAVADLIAADGAAAHRMALNQLKGGYSREFGELRSQLLELCSLVELELDFSEEEVEFADRSRLKDLLESAHGHVKALCDSYRLGNALRRGVPVAIVGAPNCGKSTLLNRLLGDDRAIVSDVPGTTRDTVEETMTLDGVLYRFIDTAGIRETDDTVEKMGIERTMDKIRQAEIVIAMADATSGHAAEEIAELRALCGEGCVGSGSGQGGGSGQGSGSSQGSGSGQGSGSSESSVTGISGQAHFIAVVNKMDRCTASEPGAIGSNAAPFPASVPGAIGISARNGDGMDALLGAIKAAGFGNAAAGQTLVTSQRHLAALRDALTSLDAARASLASGLPGDLLAEDLRAAVASIGSILGDSITPNEVLGEIFGRFCIGK